MLSKHIMTIYLPQYSIVPSAFYNYIFGIIGAERALLPFPAIPRTHIQTCSIHQRTAHLVGSLSLLFFDRRLINSSAG